MVLKVGDLTDSEDLERDLEMLSDWVPFGVVHVAGLHLWGSGLIVQGDVVNWEDLTIGVSLVTESELLKLELSLRGLVEKGDGNTDTFVQGLEGEVISDSVPIASVEWGGGLWVTSSVLVSLFVEGHDTGVLDGHDAVLAWGTGDLDWVDSGSWGLTSGDDGVGSDGHVPLEPVREGVGVSQPDGVDEVGSELLVWETRGSDGLLDGKFGIIGFKELAVSHIEVIGERVIDL